MMLYTHIEALKLFKVKRKYLWKHNGHGLEEEQKKKIIQSFNHSTNISWIPPIVPDMVD